MEEEGCDRDDALDVEEVAGFVMAVVVEVVLKVFDVPEHRVVLLVGWKVEETVDWTMAEGPCPAEKGEGGLDRWCQLKWKLMSCSHFQELCPTC